jgi:hypothetical protein
LIVAIVIVLLRNATHVCCGNFEFLLFAFFLVVNKSELMMTLIAHKEVEREKKFSFFVRFLVFIQRLSRLCTCTNAGEAQRTPPPPPFYFTPKLISNDFVFVCSIILYRYELFFSSPY